jgi:hypothetical protein
MKSDAPAPYRICVYGSLDARWSGYLANMQIAPLTSGEHTGAVLYGEVADQSELLGILNTLNMLGLSLVRVECMSLAHPIA